MTWGNCAASIIIIIIRANLIKSLRKRLTALKLPVARGMKIVSMSFNLVVKLEDCTNFFYENLKISLVFKLYFRFYYVL